MKLYIEAVDDNGETKRVYENMVTCEDCKWYGNDKRHFCGINIGFMFEDDFCSHSERRYEDE